MLFLNFSSISRKSAYFVAFLADGSVSTQSIKPSLTYSVSGKCNNSLKGHCQGDCAASWSKLLKYFTTNLFCKMKSLLQYREGNIKVFLQGRTNHNQLLATCLKYTHEELEKKWPIFSSCNPLPSLPSAAKHN